MDLLPKGPYTAHVRTRVLKTIPAIVFGIRVLKWAIDGTVGLKGQWQLSMSDGLWRAKADRQP